MASSTVVRQEIFSALAVKKLVAQTTHAVAILA